MFWLLEGFLKARTQLSPDLWETLVWFDRGKSSEILQLTRMAPVRLLIPESCDVDINFFEDENGEEVQHYEIEKKYFQDPKEVWNLLDRDHINVLCLQRFILHPSLVAPTTAKLFESLILKAMNYDLKPSGYPYSHMKGKNPRVALFLDELNNIAPSRGQGFSGDQHAGAILQHNAEQLRSQNVRLVASSHGWRKLRPGIRTSFQFLISLRGANYPSSEQPKLYRFNRLFEKLEPGQAIIAFPTKTFTDKIRIPWYGKGEDLGYIRYIGHLEPEERKSRNAKSSVSLEDLVVALKSIVPASHP
ncbi:hypothetical protein ACSAZL_06510 [Methanosarcina sp. T3]|uniref:hypothetical protein n=1 Tax=Methanosarcina sp. T3 TaxID=3439062 RepID=UPI003F863620